MTALAEMLNELQPSIQGLVNDFGTTNAFPVSKKAAAKAAKRDLDTVVDSHIAPNVVSMRGDWIDVF